MEKVIAGIIIALMVFGTLGQCSAVYSKNSSSNVSSSSTTSQQSASSPSSSSGSSSSGYSGSSSDFYECSDDYVSWQDARYHIGEYLSVRGEVKSVRTTETEDGLTTFINIGVDYPDKNRVTAVIWPEDRPYFSHPNDQKYLSSSLAGHKVCVTGVLKNYQGSVQIELIGNWDIHEYR